MTSPYGDSQPRWGSPQTYGGSAQQNPPASGYGQYAQQYPTQPYANHAQSNPATGNPYEPHQPYNQSRYGQYGQGSAQASSRVPGWRTVIPMRPLGLGDTLDAAIRVVRFNPVAFILFPVILNLIGSALSVIVVFIAGETATRDFFDTTAGASLLTVGMLFSTLVSLLIGVITTVAGTRVTLASVRGQKLTLGQTWQLAKPRLFILALRMFIMAVLLMLALAVIVGIPAALWALIFSNVGDNVALISVAVVFAFALGIFLTVAALRLAIATPILIAEDAGPVHAIRRAWSLTRGSTWYLIGLVLVVYILLGVVFGIVSVVFAFGTFGIFQASGEGAVTVATVVISVLISLVSVIIITPIMTSLLNIVYANMRFKRENYHQELLFEITQARQ